MDSLRNLTMMTDLYQLTMMYGYFRRGMGENRAAFDLYYRRAGEEISHAVAAGLEQAVQFIQSLRFDESDLAYLRSLRMFDEPFLTYLSSLRFTGDVNAMPEGTLVFPGEPIVQVPRHSPSLGQRSAPGLPPTDPPLRSDRRGQKEPERDHADPFAGTEPPR